jgi:hypothetical protein
MGKRPVGRERTRSDLGLHQEQHQHLHEEFRRELGPVVLTAFDDTDVTEVILSPDSSVERVSATGMRDTVSTRAPSGPTLSFAMTRRVTCAAPRRRHS